VAARGFLLLLLALVASGEALEDAVRTLAQSVSTHLMPGETAHVTSRNLSSLPPADVTRAQAALERALRKRVRNAVVVEITLTISENLRGYLLVAEIQHQSERAVEMVNFRLDPIPTAARSAVSIDKKIVWEQDTPILDVALNEDRMFVLDTAGLTTYERHEGKWTRASALPASWPAVRDPRGRLEIAGDSITAKVPGFLCRGASLTCEAGGDLSAGRNTIESADWPPAFSVGQLGELRIAAELDGRIHLYDSSRKQVGTFDGWGSDFSVVHDGCGGGMVFATAPGDRDSPDSVALYDLVNNGPHRVSDPVALLGPVTALWPSPAGATAVVRNLATKQYEAYSLTLDCGH
jgi:hypothetical protein